MKRDAKSFLSVAGSQIESGSWNFVRQGRLSPSLGRRVPSRSRHYAYDQP